MHVGLFTRPAMIALVGLMAGSLTIVGHSGAAGTAETGKLAETKKAPEKVAETPAGKTEKKSPEPTKQPAVKEKPAKKEKAPPAKKSRITEGATRASGAGIVAKSTACFGQTPKIEKVTPDEAKPGDKVTITGKDFGAPGCLNSVSFGPGNQAKFEQKDDTAVSTTVPSMKKKGLVILTLTTASGEDSKPVLIK